MPLSLVADSLSSFSPLLLSLVVSEGGREGGGGRDEMRIGMLHMYNVCVFGIHVVFYQFHNYAEQLRIAMLVIEHTRDYQP